VARGKELLMTTEVLRRMRTSTILELLARTHVLLLTGLGFYTSCRYAVTVDAMRSQDSPQRRHRSAHCFNI
jgi:hypothetical protein